MQSVRERQMAPLIRWIRGAVFFLGGVVHPRSSGKGQRGLCADILLSLSVQSQTDERFYRLCVSVCHLFFILLRYSD